MGHYQYYLLEHHDQRQLHRCHHYHDIYLSNKGNLQGKLTLLSIRPMNLSRLQTFLQEIKTGLDHGASINEILLYLSQTKSTDIGLISFSIEQALIDGDDINQVLRDLCVPSNRHYCSIISLESTPEMLSQHIDLLSEHLISQVALSKKVLTLLLYPFLIIQLSLLLWLGNLYVYETSIFIEICLFLGISLIQIMLLLYCFNGRVVSWLEKAFPSFQLYRIFSTIVSMIGTGQSLQNALLLMANSLQSHKSRLTFRVIYQKLRLGVPYSECFPTHWFEQEAKIALVNSNKNGNIERALTLAAKKHQSRWITQLAIISKLIPSICLIIAGLFVSSTLMSIYQPIMDLSP